MQNVLRWTQQAAQAVPMVKNINHEMRKCRQTCKSITWKAIDLAKGHRSDNHRGHYPAALTSQGLYWKTIQFLKETHCLTKINSWDDSTPLDFAKQV